MPFGVGDAEDVEAAERPAGPEQGDEQQEQRGAAQRAEPVRVAGPGPPVPGGPGGGHHQGAEQPQPGRQPQGERRGAERGGTGDGQRPRDEHDFLRPGVHGVRRLHLPLGHQLGPQRPQARLQRRRGRTRDDGSAETAVERSGGECEEDVAQAGHHGGGDEYAWLAGAVDQAAEQGAADRPGHGEDAGGEADEAVARARLAEGEGDGEGGHGAGHAADQGTGEQAHDEGAPEQGQIRHSSPVGRDRGLGLRLGVRPPTART